jgi:hypothetical protein
MFFEFFTAAALQNSFKTHGFTAYKVISGGENAEFLLISPPLLQFCAPRRAFRLGAGPIFYL